MADALISPAVGTVMWAATSGVAAYSIKKIQQDMEDKKIPIMGAMGAFVFAAQMINFSVPGTGSSGHLGGGLLLAIMLGPYAGFLTMASVLLIQALFFGDGGLLAYGCNVFNLGFYTCFIAYPLIYKLIIKKGITPRRIFAGSMAAAVIGLQLGAFSVVLQTVLSGKTELPFETFVLLMQPIHLAISIVEGLVTAAVISFVWKARPDIIEQSAAEATGSKRSVRRIVLSLILAAALIGGGLSWFASANPDGLEWAMQKTAGVTELKTTDGIHALLADIQSKTAIFPDYSFRFGNSGTEVQEKAVQAGTTLAALFGGALTLLLAVIIGFFIRFVKRKGSKATV